MERILITGASGFLGGRIAAYYRDKYEIYAPGSKEMDITDRESVKEAFEKFRPDYCVHCAAVSDVGQCDREPERSWKINVDGSRNLAEISGLYKTKCLLCSSDQVYVGSGREEAHREAEDLEPGNLYGREKKKAEEECLKVNPDCVMLRLSWMYDGRRDGNPASADRNAGTGEDMMTDRKENNGITDAERGKKEHGDFFTILAEKLEAPGTLEYPVYDRRGITDVYEVAENMEKAFRLPGGVYNFGSPNGRNTYETIYAMFSALGLDTGRLGKNETAFGAGGRNLCMDLTKPEKYGIRFTDTLEALVRNGRNILAHFIGETHPADSGNG